MTVSSEYNEQTYLCNGTTTTFTIPWKFFDDEIAVYKDKTDSLYEKDVDYVITNTGSGGSVIFNTAPESGHYITIVRNVPLSQDLQFIEGEDFPASEYEFSLDRIYMAIQENAKETDRSLKFPLGTQRISKLLPLPEAGKAIIGNSSGTGFVNSSNNIEDSASIATEKAQEAAESAEIAQDAANRAESVLGNLPMIFGATTIASNQWEETSDVSGYPYSCTISNSIDKQIPEGLSISGFITLSVKDATSGNIAPVANFEIGNMSIATKIYAKEKPVEAVSILSIIVFAGEDE